MTLKINNLKTIVVSLLMLLMWSGHAQAVKKSSMSIDQQHVTNWNQFADELFRYHQVLTKRHTIRTESEFGGYADKPRFYKEVRYYDKETDHLLSRIQWEAQNPKQVHLIEVYVYNDQGILKGDYLAAYLPKYRNAPIQTLINLHYANDELSSFRQFDATGDRIYEQCKGSFFGEPLMISLEEDDFYSGEKSIVNTFSSEEYRQCFEFVPSIATPYLSPFKLSGIPDTSQATLNINLEKQLASESSTEKKIEALNRAIPKSTNPAPLYIKRGQLYFSIHEFDSAVEDYSQALRLNDQLDDAYFGRGMAKGRLGQVAQGIEDLTVYINRNPTSSVAYTKRGVRYIWHGKLDKARHDLETAIKLDPKNAEAHDDLGVIYASKGKLEDAIVLFKKVIDIDPTYQKGFHNLAMSLQMKGHNKDALNHVNSALLLSPNNRSSLLLKGEILKSLGMTKEAANVIEQAEFLPEGNWSERFTVK